MKTILAAALAVAASAGAAFADHTTMLGIAAEREARELGIRGVDADMLTLNQLALINAVTASSDYTRNEKERQVRAIIGF
jgi:predicted metal-dependent phosphoesterase TrpH